MRWLLAPVILATSACALPNLQQKDDCRFQIRAENSTFPILLDTQTGRTWALIPHDFPKGTPTDGMVTRNGQPLSWAELTVDGGLPQPASK